MDFNAYFANIGDRISEGLPGFLGGVLGALLVLIIGYFVAKLIANLVRKLVAKTGIDRRTAGNDINVPKAAGNFVFYILMLIVLIIVLEMMGFNRALAPLENITGDFLAAIPRIVGALIIGFAGYFIAKIVSGLVGLASGAIEGFGERMGIDPTKGYSLTKIITQIVFIFIFIPILIAAIEFLGIAAISEPATDMLRAFFDAIPRIIGAAIVLFVFYFVGKFIVNILKSLLANLGVDTIPARLNMQRMLGANLLSNVLGDIAFFFIMFTGVLAAVDILEFESLSIILGDLFELVGQIFFGLIILAIGSWVANIAHDAVKNGNSGEFVASVAKYAVLALFIAIALRTMGIADDIINLAFGLTLGAIAVAVALSFGLGGREAAGKQMEHILQKFRNKQ